MFSPPLIVPVSRCAEVLFGDAKVHAAVVGLDVEALAPPAGTVEIHVDAAVARAALHVACQIGELDAAVDGSEFDLAVDVLNRNAPVGGLERQHGHGGDRQTVADGPAFIAAQPGRPVRGNVARCCRHTDRVGDLLGPGLGVGLRIDLGENLNVSPRAALDLDAAIRLGVHRHRPRRNDCELPHLAHVLTIAVTGPLTSAPVIAGGLLRHRCRQGRRRSGHQEKPKNCTFHHGQLLLGYLGRDSWPSR